LPNGLICHLRVEDIMNNRRGKGDLLTPERLQHIRRIFESAIELSPSEREPRLLEAAADDPMLVLEVRRLISAHERRNEFIDRPLANFESCARSAQPEVHRPGAMVGSYQLLQLIGEGGMGEVWRAGQNTPVRRIVAVKLIKAGMDTREVVARFESERQALALMDHPAIAKVFDAGSTQQGRPFFAMEYVSGTPITTYCEQRHLTTRERLQLFIPVCEGVQHAHQKAIIHRDLKPSNILITEVDGRPVPKIIDFGVAKAISQPLNAQSLFTRVGAILGTPNYMSPEQACSAGEDIDTRTDVYSLGVILYELLVGALPFDFRKLAFDEILHKLREANVSRPSSRFRTLSEQPSIARNRRTEPAVLIRQLRGDLDAITLKALEKDRSRRYGSPTELASDIERYLGSEPIAARPASFGYQARKYVRRHRAGVAVSLSLVLLLAVFAIAQAIQLDRITRERDRADRIANFMTTMFRVSNPSESQGNKITAREILDKASNDIGTGLAGDPELQAQMMELMGTVYYNLGLYPRAESLLRRALETRTHIFGLDRAETAQSMSDLAGAVDREGHHIEAEKLDRQALSIRTHIDGPNHPDTLRSMNHVATILVERGQYAEAEKLHRKVFDTRLKVLGPEHPDTLTSMDNLGNTLGDEGRYKEAEALERSALEIKRRVLGPVHPETLRAIHHVADTLYDEARYAEAEKFDRELLALRIRVLGPEHPETLNSMLALANALEGQAQYADAERLVRQAREIQRRILGPEHPNTLLATNNLAELLAEQGKYEEAEKLHRDVIRIRTRILGPEHPHTLYSESKLAWVLILRGRLDEAEELSRETRKIQLRVLGPNHPDTADTTCNLASIAAHRGQTEEALSLLRDAIDHGLKPTEALGIDKDPRLKPLRGDSRFATLISYARQHAATATTLN
jgi:serine/threonine protein kinase